MSKSPSSIIGLIQLLNPPCSYTNVAIEIRMPNCESMTNQRTFLKADPRKHLLDGLWPLDVAHRRPTPRPPPPPPVSGRSSAAAAAAASDRVLVVDCDHVVRGFLGEDFDVDEFDRVELFVVALGEHEVAGFTPRVLVCES